MRKPLVLMLSILCSTAFAQEIPKPEFMDQPYAYDGSTSALVQLERCASTISAKMGGASWAICSTPSSEIVAPAGKKTTFLISTGEPLLPSNLLLYHAVFKKGAREIDLKATKGASTSEAMVTCNVKKLGDDLYQLIPIEALSPGEYAFIGVGVAYAFRVD